MLTMSNQIPWTNSLIPIQLFSIIFYFFFLGQEWEVFNSRLKLGKSKQKHDSHSPSISSEIFFTNPTSSPQLFLAFWPNSSHWHIASNSTFTCIFLTNRYFHQAFIQGFHVSSDKKKPYLSSSPTIKYFYQGKVPS